MDASARKNEAQRVRLLLRGTVQGVGYRPHVYRLATASKLIGFVRNCADGLEIEIEGADRDVSEFCAQLDAEQPVGSHVASIDRETVAPTGDPRFEVRPSLAGRASTELPPDRATCDACSREIRDPSARRYRYPFANCTRCGPRFSISDALPYDRRRTTMAGFAMCTPCRREFDDPDDRRFRAEAIACPICGPVAWFECALGTACPSAALDATAHAAAHVIEGGIVGVMGVSGTHLVCDAGNERAVESVRTFKHRPDKPLAVMVPDKAAARALATLDAVAEKMLTSPASPIVLCEKRDTEGLAERLAPGHDRIGLMLPYAPIHQLLLQDLGKPVVVTSANRPGEPVAASIAEARAVTAGLAGVVLHDRPIHQRADDSVWQPTSTGPRPLRLGRGNVPSPLPLKHPLARAALGVGGDIKNAFCLARGATAYMSQHIGTLDDAATQAQFFKALAAWTSLTGISPEVVAHDAHPDSAGRSIAARLDVPTVAVQHHHAHIAACLTEHALDETVIGVAFDGTGYGDDGAIWGGEFLVADFARYERKAHLEYMPLPGGDAAVREPARIAAAYELATMGTVRNRAVRDALGDRLESLIGIVRRRVNVADTSSCGRLFDAVAAMLGVTMVATYEGQAAGELEALAHTSRVADPSAYPIAIDPLGLRVAPILEGVLDDTHRGVARPTIARRFHATLAAGVAAQVQRIAAETGIRKVVLTGGSFQNRLLSDLCRMLLLRAGLDVYEHRRVPCNDGGLALGQAMIAGTKGQC